MALFENLSDRMNHIFSKLRNKGKLTELEIKQAMGAASDFRRVFKKNLEIL